MNKTAFWDVDWIGIKPLGQVGRTDTLTPWNLSIHESIDCLFIYET